MTHSEQIEYWSREAQNANRAMKRFIKDGKSREANTQADYERFAQQKIAWHQQQAQR